MTIDDPAAKPVLLDRDGAVATISLNRPERLNALDRPVWPALTSAFEAVSGDDGVRVVILQGAGKAFSAGADVSEFAEERGSPEQARSYGDVMERTYAAISVCRHPVVARIAGSCTGAGLVLALLCDLRVSGDSGRFGAPVSRIGLAMPYPELRILFGAVGAATALELLLEGRVIDAQEARNKGLINRVVPDEQLDAAAADCARRIAAGAPLVQRWHKAYVRRLVSGVPLTDTEIADSYRSFGTEDYREGTAAFLARRRPVFKGS